MPRAQGVTGPSWFHSRTALAFENTMDPFLQLLFTAVIAVVAFAAGLFCGVALEAWWRDEVDDG